MIVKHIAHHCVVFRYDEKLMLIFPNYEQLKDVALTCAHQIGTRMLDTLYSMHSSHAHSFVDHRILELQ